MPSASCSSIGADPSVISFAGGYPDASLFPVEGIRAVMDDLLDGRHNGALQYTVSDGLPELREQVARFMRADGLDIGADDVLSSRAASRGWISPASSCSTRATPSSRRTRRSWAR